VCLESFEMHLEFYGFFCCKIGQKSQFSNDVSRVKLKCVSSLMDVSQMYLKKFRKVRFKCISKNPMFIVNVSQVILDPHLTVSQKIGIVNLYLDVYLEISSKVARRMHSRGIVLRLVSINAGLRWCRTSPDLESILYVIIWIVLVYGGLGEAHRCEANPADRVTLPRGIGAWETDGSFTSQSSLFLHCSNDYREQQARPTSLPPCNPLLETLPTGVVRTRAGAQRRSFRYRLLGRRGRGTTVEELTWRQKSDLSNGPAARVSDSDRSAKTQSSTRRHDMV